jgi:predicted nucleotidyltransferase
MISRRDIRRVCDQIAREFRPQRIVLFGAYAYGHPTTDSDVDLLIVMPFAGRATEQAMRISGRLDHRFPIDLLVRTPREIRQRLEWNDVVLREITSKGEVLYESGDAGMGGQGGG